MFFMNALKKCPSSHISINKTHDRKFGRVAYEWRCWPFLHYSLLYSSVNSQGIMTAKLSKAVQYYHYKGTQKQTNNTLSSQKCKEL